MQPRVAERLATVPDEPGAYLMRGEAGDVIYVGANQNPGYSRDNNFHYEALEESGDDLSLPTVLEPRFQ